MSKRERESLHLRAKTFELTAVLMKVLSERERKHSVFRTMERN